MRRDIAKMRSFRRAEDGSMVIFTMFLIGIMLILGFATRVAALLNGATLAAFIWKMKLGDDPSVYVDKIQNNFAGPDGYMTALVLFLVCLSLILTGPGAMSLDGFLINRKPKEDS